MKQVALITGGSRGIGLGIARELALAGFDLAINGIRPEAEITGILDSIRSIGAEIIYCQGNVALAAERKKILAEISQYYNRINVLVNNAGIAPRERRDILESSEESFDELISTNLKSMYFLSKEVAKWMIEQHKSSKDFQGCIINISSISATIASVNRGEYCISKAGISMATQLFAVRLGEYNIPVYEVRPGIISTDMTSGVKEKYDTLIANGLCLQQRWGLPEDVGKCVCSLAKGNFPYSTGQVFTIDGGLTIGRL